VWGPLPVDLSFRHLVQNESLRDFSLCVQNEVDRALADGALTNELGGQSDLYERALELWKVRDESVYWRLLSRSAFLRIRKPEWSFLEQIARQVFDLPEEALLWRLKVWLDWGLCRPDSEQRGELRRLAQLHGLPGAYQERLLRSESAAQEVAHNGTGMD
jgi:hypothetical protein